MRNTGACRIGELGGTQARAGMVVSTARLSDAQGNPPALLSVSNSILQSALEGQCLNSETGFPLERGTAEWRCSKEPWGNNEETPQALDFAQFKERPLCPRTGRREESASESWAAVPIRWPSSRYRTPPPRECWRVVSTTGSVPTEKERALTGHRAARPGRRVSHQN